MSFIHQALDMSTELLTEWISKELLFLSQLKTALVLQTLTQSMLETSLRLWLFPETSP